MSHLTALYIALAYLAFFAFDWLAHDWAWTLFLADKGFDLIIWLEFWR